MNYKMYILLNLSFKIIICVFNVYLIDRNNKSLLHINDIHKALNY